MARLLGISTFQVYFTLAFAFGIEVAIATPSLFNSRDAFEKYISSLGLVGSSVNEGTARLASDGFNCDPPDKLPLSATVVCGKSIRGLTVVEKLTVTIYRSSNGATVASVTTGYLPISSP